MDKVAYNEKEELLKLLARPETDPQKGLLARPEELILKKG